MPRKPKPSGQKTKERQRSEKSYERPIGHRPVFKSILIVCEGSKTEPTYFKELRRSLRLSSTEVEVYGKESDSAPIRVVEHGISYKVEREQQVKRGRENKPAIDKVWCVIDVENPNDNKSLGLAIEKANSVSYLELIVSNPCFEFWYLLHFCETSRPFISAGEVVDELKQYMPEYEKHRSIYNRLLEKMDLAIARAEGLLNNHPDFNSSIPNPSTMVHKLILELRALSTRPRS